MPKTVLTMHNIDHVRNARLLKNLRPGLEFFFRYIDQGRLVSWEHHALGDFDRVVAMSQLDLDCMRALRCDMRGAVVPNGVDVDGLPFGDGAPRGSQDVVFVASMDTDANHDAAMFFVEDIWPLVKAARPRARITFVGRNPRKELVMAANGDDLVVTGSVPDVVPFYRAASLAIVPLRVGGGTRLKILEAMALGVPVVSTSVGCEGLELADGEDLCMADSASGFAQAVVALLDSPTMRDRLRVNARRRVEEIYDWKVVARAQMAVYEDLAEDRRD
jgi:glycosyltransferase involved in cell wall biosynthesis